MRFHDSTPAQPVRSQHERRTHMKRMMTVSLAILILTGMGPGIASRITAQTAGESADRDLAGDVQEPRAGSWSRQTSGTTNTLGSVSFSDATNGWAAGEAATL